MLPLAPPAHHMVRTWIIIIHYHLYYMDGEMEAGREGGMGVRDHPPAYQLVHICIISIIFFFFSFCTFQHMPASGMLEWTPCMLNGTHYTQAHMCTFLPRRTNVRRILSLADKWMILSVRFTNFDHAVHGMHAFDGQLGTYTSITIG
jgi:hypothetical protein